MMAREERRGGRGRREKRARGRGGENEEENKDKIVIYKKGTLWE